MKLDRNVSGLNGRGKYMLINARRLFEGHGVSAFADLPSNVQSALALLRDIGALETGLVGGGEEFFVVKLKDRNAPPALLAYADSVQQRDPEFAVEVTDLALRAGENHPLCKDPD